MALTKEMIYDENGITHRFGDEYLIPVTLKIMDGATEKCSITKNVEHNVMNSIDFSINHPQVKKAFEDEIKSFNDIKGITEQSLQITASLQSLKESLSLAEKK